LPANINSPNNPKVIHLKFVIAPSAVHNEVLEFTIGKIRATHFKDSMIYLDPPHTLKFSYRIHSYVPV
jgi:hypothetical protein